MEIEAIRCAQRRLREGEIEDEQVPAGVQDAGHFAQSAGPRFHVAEAEGDGYGIEGASGEGKVEGVGDDGAAKAFFPGAPKHGFAKIGAGDLAKGAGALDGKGEVTAAGGKVEKRGGAPGGGDRGGAAAPEIIETAREEMIGEVVSSGDGREKGVDELGLLQSGEGYLRGQMTRIKKNRPMAVRMERATRKL